MLKTVEITTKKRIEFIDVTSIVRQAVTESGVRDGICLVYVPHTTCGITVNEHADPDVVRDILSQLEKIVPESGNYSHIEGNSDAHIKASMIVQARVSSSQILNSCWVYGKVYSYVSLMDRGNGTCT